MKVYSGMQDLNALKNCFSSEKKTLQAVFPEKVSDP